MGVSFSETLGGGSDVKVSTLSVGNYIRDPKKASRIMKVIDKDPTQILCQGIEAEDAGEHRWISCNSTVTKVTNVSTEVVTLPVPLLYYTMNDNAASTTVIDSKGISNGTSARNTSTMSVAGKLATALEFNGSSDQIDVPNVSATNFNLISSLSFDFLIYPHTVGGGNMGTIICKQNESGAPWQIYLYSPTTSGARIVFKFGLTLTGASITYYYARTVDDVITLNQWSHVVVTITTPNDVKIAVNGQEKTLEYGYDSGKPTPPSSGTWYLSDDAANIRIGNYYFSNLTTNYWFDGIIDNLRVFKKPLTSLEILTISNGGNGLAY